MSFAFDIHKNGDAIRYFLPGLSESIETSLWIRPASKVLTPEDLASLLHAFAPQHGIFWRGQYSIGISRTATDTFPEVPSLVGECIARTVIDYPSYNQSVYTDVSWMAADPADALEPLLLLLTELRSQRLMAFLPRDRFLAQKWTKIVQGATWLWLCRDWIDRFPVPLLHSDEVIASYVNLTVEVGGTAILLWEDSNLKRGFVLFGAHLHPAEQYLRNMAPQEPIFEKLRAVGISLQLLI